ncbi:hypothetical protein ACFQME_12315, partial [Luteimonas weifangensis]
APAAAAPPQAGGASKAAAVAPPAKGTRQATADAAAIASQRASAPAAPTAPTAQQAFAVPAAAPAPPAADSAAETAEAAEAAEAAGNDEPVNDVPPATVATPQVRDAWLARIRELAAAGRSDEARASLREFRHRYPDYRLPDDLRALLP